MHNEKMNVTKLGLFVTVAILAFAYGIFRIGEQENLFGSTFTLSSIFQNVNGLQSGNSVRFSGINVGTVDNIIIINDTTLQVNMMVEDHVKPFIKKNAIATIGTDGLVGNMIINITPGGGASVLVSDGDFIQSNARIETEAVLSKLGNTTENIALLTINLLEVAEKINNGDGGVSRIINDSDIADDFQLTIQNLKLTSQQMSTLSIDLQNSMELVNQGEGLLGYLLKDTLFESKANKAIESLDNLIKDRTEPIMKHLEQSSLNIETSTDDLKNVIRDIELDSGLVGSLLKDTILSNSFKKTIINLNKGSELLNEDLEALRHNFLFRSYFRKLERKMKKNRK